MSTITAAPAVIHYSEGYQREIGRIWRDVDVANRTGCLQCQSLVWRARSAYKAAWKRELLRFRESR